jgi:hypothetical protein
VWEGHGDDANMLLQGCKFVGYDVEGVISAQPSATDMDQCTNAAVAPHGVINAEVRLGSGLYSVWSGAPMDLPSPIA